MAAINKKAIYSFFGNRLPDNNILKGWLVSRICLCVQEIDYVLSSKIMIKFKL